MLRQSLSASKAAGSTSRSRTPQPGRDTTPLRGSASKVTGQCISQPPLHNSRLTNRTAVLLRIRGAVDPRRAGRRTHAVQRSKNGFQACASCVELIISVADAGLSLNLSGGGTGRSMSTMRGSMGGAETARGSTTSRSSLTSSLSASGWATARNTEATDRQSPLAAGAQPQMLITNSAPVDRVDKVCTGALYPLSGM